MPDHSPELPFGDQQSRANPALDLIAWPPAFDVAANRLNDRKRRLDHVGATQSAAELIGDAQLVHGERFLQPFLQTACRAGIEIHQLAMQFLQSALGFA